MHVETRWRSQRECLQASSVEYRLEAREFALMLGRRRVRTPILPVRHSPTRAVFGVQTLVRGVESDSARRDLAKGIIDVASSCGAGLVASHVERRQEQATPRMLGANLFRGLFYGPRLTT